MRLLAWAALVGAQWTYPVPQAPTSPPELSNATTTGMTVTWEPTIESESYAVDAYRVEVLSLQERHKGWQVLDDAVEEARTRNEVQFINVRVDRGSRVTGGGFWLYLAYDGIHPIDTDHKQAVTPEIPWDASAAQMKSALEALDTVNVVQVRRCDASFLPNKDNTGTGAEAWVGRCPFGHLGGYTWVVEFERPRTEMDEAWSWAYPRDVKLARDGWNERLQKDVKSAQEAGRMPLLAVWKETISLRDGYKWSGPGAGIEVWRASNYQPCGSTLHELNLGHDFDAPMPPPSLCTYRAENLKRPGGLYAFRISAHNAAGWSAPSQPSSYRRLDAVEPPPRPIAPVWAVPSDARFRQGSATLYASRPDQTGSEFAAPAAAFDVQYKYEGDDTWLDAGRVNADESGWAARTIDDLDVERKVVARVRARNAAGLSAWSGASPPGHVTRDARPPPPSKPALELDGDEMQVRWLPAAAGTTNARRFSLETQAWRGHGFSTPDQWERADNSISIVETPQSDEVQTVTCRVDGTFRLRLPVKGSYDTGTITTDLHRGSLAGDVVQALEGLDAVSQGSVSVRLISPGKWRVHFKDPDAIAGEDLRASNVFPQLLGESVRTSEKWNRAEQGPEVLIERTSLASSEVLKESLEARVRNLEPHTHYRVRVKAFSEDEEGGEWSEPSDWLQTPDAARVYELAGRSKVRAADGTSHARTAVDYRPALANDPDYVQGAAVGGLGVSGWNSAENDGDGGGGLVVVAAYTGLAAHPIPHSRQVFFASRVAQTYAVPSRHSGRPGAAQERPKSVPKTVSYTHLTLPTILLV